MRNWIQAPNDRHHLCGPRVHSWKNKYVLANCGIPESILKKKIQSTAYHFVREGAVRDEWQTFYLNSHDNEADLLKKKLPSGENCKGFVGLFLHHILSGV